MPTPDFFQPAPKLLHPSPAALSHTAHAKESNASQPTHVRLTLKLIDRLLRIRWIFSKALAADHYSDGATLTGNRSYNRIVIRLFKPWEWITRIASISWVLKWGKLLSILNNCKHKELQFQDQPYSKLDRTQTCEFRTRVRSRQRRTSKEVATDTRAQYMNHRFYFSKFPLPRQWK